MNNFWMMLRSVTNHKLDLFCKEMVLKSFQSALKKEQTWRRTAIAAYSFQFAGESWLSAESSAKKKFWDIHNYGFISR